MHSETNIASPPLTVEQLAARIRAEFPGSILDFGPGVDFPYLRVSPSDAVAVSRYLRDSTETRYQLLSDLTCVDYLDREPRFDIVYHLYSFSSHSYLRLKFSVPETPVEFPTVTDVWPAANWLEREVYDMFGITFTGHPDLRRILSPEGWPYNALRRDFPLQGPGMVKLYDNVSDIF